MAFATLALSLGSQQDLAIVPLAVLCFGMATVQITLSDVVAEEAAREGLLESGNIESLLRDQLAAARIDRLQAARKRLAAPALPAMTSTEIQTEIAAYRAEQRRAAGA